MNAANRQDPINNSISLCCAFFSKEWRNSSIWNFDHSWESHFFSFQMKPRSLKEIICCTFNALTLVLFSTSVDDNNFLCQTRSKYFFSFFKVFFRVSRRKNLSKSKVTSNLNLKRDTIFTISNIERSWIIRRLLEDCLSIGNEVTAP